MTSAVPGHKPYPTLPFLGHADQLLFLLGSARAALFQFPDHIRTARRLENQKKAVGRASRRWLALQPQGDDRTLLRRCPGSRLLPGPLPASKPTAELTKGRACLTAPALGLLSLSEGGHPYSWTSQDAGDVGDQPHCRLQALTGTQLQAMLS